ncbi:MAG TPA: M1 family aminopeptidase [Gemmatimonadales bacterium]|nr:M1 family aminopeptidase [Gemmatimonadales bacterium]
MFRSFGLSLITLSFPIILAAQANRPAGQVGEYTPPRAWAQRQHSFDLQHQKIEIGFDVDQRSMTGQVTTTLVVTNQPTDAIRLDASNLVIDAARDRGGKRLRFVADTAGVTVRLGRRAPVGDTVVFTIAYHGKPERGMYFVPRRRTMWTQGEAIETRSWVPTYDAPNDKTTWEILVTADTSMSVLSNGRLVGVTKSPDGAHKVWDWSQEKPASTYLYSIVVGPYVFLRDNWRGIPVEYFVLPDTLNATWRTFGETPSMIETYSRVLGVNFPWAKYDQAIIPDFTFGGMENVSATTQTDLALHAVGGEPTGSGRGLNAHELAHQWFGDLTTTATWAHIWLNEGLTTYMESVQEEKSRGWEAAQWNWMNQQLQGMGADQNQARPLVLGESPGMDPINLFFSGHVYPKGAQVAHQLRRLLGDSVFWAGMKRFLTDNGYRPVETRDYAIAMEKVSGRDLDWFFDQWAYGIGYPTVKVTRGWNEGSKTLTLTVNETQAIDSTHPFFRFPATIRIVTRDSVVRRDIMVTEQGQRFDLPLPAAPVTFRFDEGGWLLGTVTTDQSVAELAELARHDVEFRARYWALTQLAQSTDSTARAARQFIVLNDPSDHMRQEALHQLSSGSDSTSWTIVMSALADPSDIVRGEAIHAIGRRDSAAAQPIAVDLIRHDRSFYVQGHALDVYNPSLASEGTALLVELTKHGGSLGVRLTAAGRLHLKPDAAGADALEAMTAVDEPRTVRQVGLGLLGQWPDKTRAIAVATKYLNDGDPLFAVSAVGTLSQAGGDAGKAVLRQAMARETRVTVRAAMQQALASR